MPNRRAIYKRKNSLSYERRLLIFPALMTLLLFFFACLLDNAQLAWNSSWAQWSLYNVQSFGRQVWPLWYQLQHSVHSLQSIHSRYTPLSQQRLLTPSHKVTFAEGFDCTSNGEFIILMETSYGLALKHVNRAAKTVVIGKCPNKIVQCSTKT